MAMTLQRGQRAFKAQGAVTQGLRFTCTAILVFLLVRATTVSVARSEAAEAEASPPKAPITFNIPAQPLSDALYIYSNVTGIEILVPGDMLTRRQSSPLLGTLAPEDALRALLSGTELAPRYTGAGAFTLVPSAQDAALTTTRMPRYPEYSGALQAAVTRALCRLGETRPGGYRVAARLWVGPSGAVTRVGMLGSTGNPDRDAALTGLLGGLVLDEAPPANLPQPTTLVVLPRQQRSAECGDKSAMP